MKLTKYFVSLSLLATIGLSAVPVYASNDNFNYSFHIGGWKQNSHSAGRYRQTDNYKNNWKVKLSSSNEGPHTVSTFWLEDTSGINQSESVNKTAGAGPSYRRVKPGVKNLTVLLTAQNNNLTTVGYNVSGYWDEETGVIK